MDLEWHPEAVEEFLELAEDVQKELNETLETLPDKGLEWNRVELVDRPEIDFTCYRLKIDPDRKPEINHRILFKVVEDSFLILKIGKRPEFYTLENLEKARKRLE